MKIIFSILLLISGLNIRAQDWFSKYSQGTLTDGYIITITGDTLLGKVQFDYPIIMQKRLTFTGSNNPNPVIYQPNDIRGYSIGNMKWESIPVILSTYNGAIKFNRFGILCLGDGPIRLYRIFIEADKLKKNLSGTKAEIIYKGIGLTQDEKTFENLYISKLENPASDINNKAFKKNFISLMSGMVSENAGLVKKIQGKEYAYTDLKKIVTEYNEWYLKKIYNRSP